MSRVTRRKRDDWPVLGREPESLVSAYRAWEAASDACHVCMLKTPLRHAHEVDENVAQRLNAARLKVAMPSESIRTIDH
ncbi:MAG: hypothetical protein ABIV63_03405 [Caldimonas sp.]